MQKKTKRLSAVIATIACAAIFSTVSASALATDVKAADTATSVSATVKASQTTFSVVDKTEQKWLGNDGAEIKAVDNATHTEYTMTKVSDTKWTVTGDFSFGRKTNVSFIRVVDGNVCNEWSAGVSTNDAYDTYTVYGDGNGNWGPHFA